MSGRTRGTRRISSGGCRGSFSLQLNVEMWLASSMNQADIHEMDHTLVLLTVK